MTVENYLATMAIESPEGLPNFPRLVGANGPRMLSVAARCGDGAVPSVVPPAYVRHAREVLGPDKLLAVAVPLIGESNREVAQDLANHVAKGVAGFDGSPYRANLLRLGYSEAELAGPSDRFRDDVIAYGAGDDVAASVQRFLDAGADHVTLTPMTSEHDTAVDWLERVAPSVLTLRNPAVSGA
jgi:probable F420-dependent oxidoreductase